MDEKYLIINYIFINEQETTVGATDCERWTWDREDGDSGVNARTSVWVTLEDKGKPWATTEKIGLFCSPGDPWRELSITHIADLLEIAWEIKKQNLDRSTAQEKYFGLELR